MRFLVRPALALLLTAGVAVGFAKAEDLATPNFKLPDGASAKGSSVKGSSVKTHDGGSMKAAAKPDSQRRSGELEGWEGGTKTPTAGKKSKRPIDAIGERSVPDGGLPLPERRFTEEPGMGRSPVSIDQNGNMGGAFRF